MTIPVQYTIGLVIYPGMTQLDITGPHQVFSFMPNAQVHLLWKTLEPVTSAEGLQILPSMTFDDCPVLDVLCVPGGPGQPAMMSDADMLAFLKRQSTTARFITSVCTGSLILAAAGLLQGYQAATHWTVREHLAMLGVDVKSDRVVVDRNRITGGGVTAGIDFGLVIAAQLCGEETAKVIELALEYNPDPPFGVGSPEKAGAILVEQVKQFASSIMEDSLQATKQASAQLSISV